MTRQQTNSLHAVNYTLQMNKYPEVEFKVTKINIPGLTTTPIQVQYNSKPVIPILPDSVAIDYLDIEFEVDEDLYNYLSIYIWIVNITQARVNSSLAYEQSRGLFTDISLRMTTNNRNDCGIAFRFTNAFPEKLSSVNLEANNNNQQPILATTRFQFEKMLINHPQFGEELKFMNG